jgi:two-component system, chemotaxis family, protein-glutamate methylesterase/glutaminase
MSAVVSASAQAVSVPDPIRVMVVDDSAIARGLVARWLADEPDLELVASLHTGRAAVNWLEKGEADVAILDVEMPELDGLSALPLLLARRPDLVVIMASTLTRRNAEVSLKALSLGAADYVAKPEAGGGGIAAVDYRRQLIDKVRHIAARRRSAKSGSARLWNSPGKGAIVPAKLRPPGAKVPRVLLVGSSTGGPQALLRVLPHLGGAAARAPILVAQHMPATFTTILAEHIGRATGRSTREAIDGEPVADGSIYVAPGGRHMRVALDKGRAFILLDDGPPVNFCKPAVDPLFESASTVWGPRSLALILTGMGSDGTRGARAIAAAGGTILAQDEATSVVWGMPGSAAQAGLCTAVLPLSRIAAEVTRLFSGEGR